MSVSSSYGSLKEAMNNFSYNKILKELKSQSNFVNYNDINECSCKEINNKNKSKIINIKYKYNYYSSQNPINKELKRVDVKNVLHKKNIFDNYKKLYSDEKKIYKSNKYINCTYTSSEMNELNISSSILSNQNYLSRNSKVENSNQYLCFSDRKSYIKIGKFPQNLKCNSHINIIEKDNNNNINNSNVKKNLRNSIFKKPILNKNDIMTSFKMKYNIRNNNKIKKNNYNNNISIKNINTSNYKIQF
jgi:hypothetical protein